MGTAEEDFAPLREHRAAPAAIGAVVGGVPFEDLLTGYGVAVAADTALRARWGWGWEGRSVAIEGFGKVGGGVAREVIRRGGRVAAVSTVAGYIADPTGLDVGLLLAVRTVTRALPITACRSGRRANCSRRSAPMSWSSEPGRE